MRFPLIFFGFSIVLCGCQVTQEMNGKIQGSDEVFSGVATLHAGIGSGKIDITSSKGAVCHSNFEYTSDAEGDGVIACEDGRGGTFKFVSGYSFGRGFGTLGGKPFTFVLGEKRSS